MINEPSSKKTISSKKLHLDQHKISRSAFRLNSKAKHTKISLNKYHLINYTNDDSFKSNNIRYRNPFLKTYRHLNSSIFSNLTSREPKGFYNYDTLTNLNSISDNSKRSYFEDMNKNEEKNNKKLFLTISNGRRKLILRNNDINENITNMKTAQTIETGKKNKTKKKIKISTKSLSNQINLENILLKKNLKSDKTSETNIPKKLKRSSIIDRLLFQVTNPDDCFEDYISSEKPGDKYIKFYKQIKKKKNQTYKILLDVMLEQKKTFMELKQYNAQIQRTEYILKTKFNNQHLQKYKSSIT